MNRAVLTVLMLAVLVLCGATGASADLPPPTSGEETLTMLQPDVTSQAAADLVAMAPIWRDLGVKTEDLASLSLLSEIYALPVTDSGATDDAPVTSAAMDYEGTVHDHRQDEDGSDGFWRRE